MKHYLAHKTLHNSERTNKTAWLRADHAQTYALIFKIFPAPNTVSHQLIKSFSRQRVMLEIEMITK